MTSSAKADLLERAVWLSDLIRVRNVIRVLGELYDRDTWTGGMIFADIRGGLILFAWFNPDRYADRELPFECLFPEADLRPITLDIASADHRRYRPYMDGIVLASIRGLRLLPA